jgi:hypothetical protein
MSAKTQLKHTPLQIAPAWVGEGAWNLNRWAKRGDVPSITKEQMDKFQLKY